MDKPPFTPPCGYSSRCHRVLVCVPCYHPAERATTKSGNLKASRGALASGMSMTAKRAPSRASLEGASLDDDHEAPVTRSTKSFSQQV
jgi:hypothetical protein